MLSRAIGLFITCMFFGICLFAHAKQTCSNSQCEATFQGYSVASIRNALEELFPTREYGRVRESKSPKIAKTYLSKMDIFELKDFPGLIFKSDRRGTRIENFARVKELIKEKHLDALVLPEAIEVDVLVAGKIEPVTVEQKIEVTGPFAETKDAYLKLFKEMKTNPRLYKELEAAFTQLATLTAATGFWDVGYSNIPLVKNSSSVKIAIVDLNDMYDFRDDSGYGLAQRAKSGIQGLLERLHKDFHRKIVAAAAAQMKLPEREVMMTVDRVNIYGGRTFKFYDYKDVELRYEMKDMM